MPIESKRLAKRSELGKEPKVFLSGRTDKCVSGKKIEGNDTISPHTVAWRVRLLRVVQRQKAGCLTIQPLKNLWFEKSYLTAGAPSSSFALFTLLFGNASGSLSTSSIIAIGAASPTLVPAWKMRV